MQTKPSIVFCHGIWADGSCFSKVIPTLQAEGNEVMAAQYGLDTLAGDVATVKRTLGRVSSPAILVGHSYGGAVITPAGTDDRVAGLVYIAAVGSGRGRDRGGSAKTVPHHRNLLPHRSRGRTRLDAPGRRQVFRRRPFEAGAESRRATHCAPAADLFRQKLDGVAWRSKPSSYILATSDRTVHLELQRFLAKRMGATTYEVASSHVPMLSNPKPRDRRHPYRRERRSWTIHRSGAVRTELLRFNGGVQRDPAIDAWMKELLF